MSHRESSNLKSWVFGQPSLWAAGQPTHREIWPVPPVPFTRDNRVDERAIDKLVEFYVNAGVDGLFILAYSGEAFELSAEEQLAVCRRVVEQTAGRLRIVVAGNFGGDLNSQIDQLNRITDYGPDATIIFLSTLPDRTQMVDDLLHIASHVDAPLGVYECPVPEHRLLSAEDVATLAATGQFVFMKETSRDRQLYRAKLLATQDSPLKLYQANWGQLPRSLDDGCPGFCGIIANVFPELADAFCNADSLSSVGRTALHEVLSYALSCITQRHYPATMKYVLQKRGIPMNAISRMKGARDVDAEDVRRLDEMLDQLSLLSSPSELVSLISKRVNEPSDKALRGPHLPAEWVTRASTVVNPSEID
ncbi:MAG: dihydrodipicolinate synthase family protein [Pirellulales bacterium]